MRFNSWSKIGLTLFILSIAVLAMSIFRTHVTAQMNLPQEERSQTVTLKGRIVDLTCAVQGKIMTGTWNNIAADHMMADGNIQKGCMAMCLMGGQPAALLSDDKIVAIFACNPRSSGGEEAFYYLARYGAQPLEIEGYWADGGPASKVLVPLRVRRGVLGVLSRVREGGGWRDLDCATMPMHE